MFEKLKAKLVCEGRDLLKMWSNQFALLVGAAAAWAVENQSVVIGYVNEIGQPYRSILTFIVVAGLPILLRSIRQPNLPSNEP